MTIVTTEYSYLVTHPRINPAEQGLISLNGRDVVPSLWINFFSQKVTKKEKKY